MKRDDRERRSRWRYYFFNIFLFLLIVGIISVSAIVFFCDTETVKVKGNTVASDKELEKIILSDKYDVNTVYAVVRNFIFPHKSIPFVESYRVDMQGRNTLVVTIKEKALYGFVLGNKKGTYVYYDDRGNVMEVSKLFLEDVFFVEGLVAKDPKSDKILPVGNTNVKTILIIQEALGRDNLPVQMVSFREDGTITFQVEKILVNLGTRMAISEKLKRLPYILLKLKGQAGTLHLEEWSEENTDIVFEKTG